MLTILKVRTLLLAGSVCWGLSTTKGPHKIIWYPLVFDKKNKITLEPQTTGQVKEVMKSRVNLIINSHVAI